MQFPMLLICLIFLTLLAPAQKAEPIDSLTNLLDTELEPSKKAYVLDELSYVWFSSNLDSSLHYGKLALESFYQLNGRDLKGTSQAMSSIAIAYHYMNQWDSAIFWHQEAIRVRKEDKDTLKLASSLNNMGVLYMDKGAYDEASRFFIEAMNTRKMLSDRKGVAITRVNLGLLFKKQGNFEKAISYYEEAEIYFDSVGLDRNLETVLLNIGSIYNTIENYEKGLSYNQRLKELSSKRGSTRNLAKSYVNLSNAYQGLGKLDSGLYYANKGLEFFKEASDTLNIAHSLLSIATFHFEKRNYHQSIAISHELNQLLETLKNREIIVENSLLLAKAFSKKNRNKEAYESLLLAFSEKDSLLSASLNESISDLTLKYETEQKESEIANLKVKNQLSEIERQKSLNQRNIYLFILFALALAAIPLIILLRNKSKTNKIISASLKEKELLLKEIHHRVKNNLQVISSLLSLQTRYIDDEKALEAVNEGQNRVKSMALIHQKLYQNDNLLGVEARDYIQNLTGTLQAAYTLQADKVDVVYDVANIRIDVDTIIPMGLILNELISNAFKHAFTNKDEGELKILLQEKGDELVLIVEDDGKGMKEEDSKKQSFGMRMIHSLAMKLEAEIEQSFNQKGTRTKLIITKYKLV